MESNYFPMKSFEIQSSGWKIETFKRYAEYLESEIKLGKNTLDLFKLITYCEKHKERDSFRWEIEVGSVYFLAGVFPKERLIVIGSKQLGMELTLIAQPDDYEHRDELKIVAEKLAEIPSGNTPTQIEYLSHVFDLPLFSHEDYQDVLSRTEINSLKLIEKVNEYKQSLFERFSNFSLDLTANYMLIRVHLLKFLAILPCLDHDKEGDEVARILKETLSRLIVDSNIAKDKSLKGQSRPLPQTYIRLASVVLFLIKFVPVKALAYLVRASVSLMAKRFIAGENISKAQSSLQALLKSGRDATIDQLGELVVSSDEATEYKNKVLDIIDGLAKQIPQGERNGAGILRAHVSIKITALTHNFTPQNFEYCYEVIAPRLKEILLAGKKSEVFINIDAEHYHYRDTVLRIYRKLLLETSELADYADTGIVIQAYLRDGYKHFLDVLDLAKERELLMPIRLVKGAYWDAETIEAQAHNFPAVQFLNKEETDIHFRQIIEKALEHGEFLQLAIASHNIQDHVFSETLRTLKFPNAPIIEHQCLHMTYEALSVGMAKMNWIVRNYIPVGHLLVGMAYLVRRIMENSSQVGVLTMMRSHKKAMNYKGPSQIMREKCEVGDVIFDDGINVLTQDFKNIYPLRTYLDHHLDRITTKLNHDLKNLNEGKLFVNEGDEEIFCSSRPELKLGRIRLNTKEQVNQEIETLFDGFIDSRWSRDLSYRSECLFKLSDELLMNREALCSLIMLEAGKTIDEAVADVDEAIDFIHFYIREQTKISSTDQYEGAGVIGVIAPWNFPLAIPCGMTVAALVAGNTAILKPAEQTPLIALEFHRLALKAGVPKNAFSICVGEGDIGAAITDHDLVTGVVFTGSKNVGELIYKKITQKEISERYKVRARGKFAITEMGGKNAIIVTNNCELDETVSGILYSAFAHSGQKCSAASRIIIDEEIKNAFKIRFRKAVLDLKVGESVDTATFINPLVSLEDKQRVQAMAKRAVDEVAHLGGDVIVDLSEGEYPGYCVGPSVFELTSKSVLNESTIASEEVFGPLIHLIPYKNLDEAIEIFNSTQYALTGGIYCQSQNDIDYLTPKLHVGNVYINRPNTGARVGIEPFGGFKMSGTGPKAGGVDYLFKFNNPKVNSKESKIDHIKIGDTELIENYSQNTSLLAPMKIRTNCAKFISSLLHKFSEVFGIIDEETKDLIQSLSLCLEEGFFDLETREFPNKEIPGQMSFSKKDIKIGCGIFIDFHDDLSAKKLQDLLVNLIIGNGVTILTCSESNYQKWTSFANLAYRNGFSDLNLSVAKVGVSNLDSFIKKYSPEFYVCANSTEISPILKTVLAKKENKSLTKIIYSDQHLNLENSIASFTHTRAFAINTMRHGAPLTMEL